MDTCDEDPAEPPVCQYRSNEPILSTLSIRMVGQSNTFQCVTYLERRYIITIKGTVSRDGFSFG
jgi:hypothetical protein